MRWRRTRRGYGPRNEKRTEEWSGGKLEKRSVASLHHSITPSPRFLTMARWHSCNVVEIGPDARRVWQFDAQKFQLSREQTAVNGKPLPPGLVGKSWTTLWRQKLNVAWLPPE